MWKNLNIGKKIFLVMAIITLVIIVQTIFSTIGVYELESEMEQLKNARIVGRDMLRKEIDHLNWMIQLERFAGIPESKYIDAQKDDHACGFGKVLYGSERQEIERMYPELIGKFREVEIPHARLHATADKMEKARQAGNEKEVRAILAQESQKYMQDTQAKLGEIIGILDAKANTQNQRFLDQAKSVRTNLYLAFGIGLVVATALGILIARGVAYPIRMLSNYTDEIVRGDFNATPNIDQNDEIGAVTKSVQAMVDKIKQAMNDAEEKTKHAEEAAAQARIATEKAEEATRLANLAKSEGMHTAAGQLATYIEVISAAASELSAQIEESERIASDSSQRLGEAATAMNEMNATVQEVARNASSASGVSTQTRANAEEGQKILTNAMTSIYQAKKVSMELKEDMSTLYKHTQNISQIMAVISDIADQTNLLALNAAIEAARAGEAGRGFAVVADEVRKLAEKTMASTNDVSSAITAIQTSAQQSVGRMEEALSEVEKATASATESGEALKKIVLNVEETADQVQAIATASEEQSAASEEITRSIANVNDMSAQTTSSMAEAAKAVSDLAVQAENLTNLVKKMQQE
ncbi:MAG: CZB domain-containing protein [Desulfovibrionaceae bacterium]|nr:CZB domain-containing protein [Desulfovibrionaceae bacterium]